MPGSGKFAIELIQNVACCTGPYHVSRQWAMIWLSGLWVIWKAFLIRNFQAHFSDWWLRYILWNCPLRNATGLTDNRSTMVQVMAWCLMAPSHYLSQCRPRSLSSYSITRLQWVKGVKIVTSLLNSTVFTKISKHIGHFEWMGPNVWQDISQIWIEYIIKHIGQMSD